MFSEKNDLICAAFVRARKELKNPERSARAHHGKYAKLETVTALVNPILAEFDLTFTQTVRATSETIRVRTTLIHSSGQIMWTDSAPMPLGPKKDNFTVAGATTYARRYGLITLLGIEQDEDDDGQTAMQAFITGNDPEDQPSDEPEDQPSDEPEDQPSDEPEDLSSDEPEDQPHPPNLISEQATAKHPNAKAIDALKEKVSTGKWTYEDAVARVEERGLQLTPKQTADLRAAKPRGVAA
jgi:hypothetical protein